eukprot:CAMPEP_0174698978 /NCGR_PEP_ID=MMETSP1094-20130205/4409_1 /TAXON_ID=156173 /ORGANISM="Chrysochromulina brevifilum, Strain UTEX LB 985" /LENGTH=110 /DNA_ID=CAMNT_0015896233 /DNA_START=54 /DNA_END=386 /DNA_ORIENTATION=+
MLIWPSDQRTEGTPRKYASHTRTPLAVQCATQGSCATLGLMCQLKQSSKENSVGSLATLEWFLSDQTTLAMLSRSHISECRAAEAEPCEAVLALLKAGYIGGDSCGIFRS